MTTADITYGDPTLCPGCRQALPYGAARCPHCDLSVRHALAGELFTTLTRADTLLTQLRRVSQEHPAQSLEGAQRPTQPTPPPPPPTPTQPAPSGMTSASVPRILLGLGALCLLVAAVIFLAVSWAWLGVGGRTAVLVGLTAASGGAAAFLHRHDLRIGAEALASVSLGLLALDVTGADNAGWLGDISPEAVAIIAGLVVAAVGTGLAAALRPALAAPQVAAGVGAFVAYIATLGLTDHYLVAGHLWLAVLVGAAYGCHRLGLVVERWAMVVVACLAWAATAAVGLITALEKPTVESLWLDDGSGWSLLVSAAALLAPGLVLRKDALLVAGGAGGALLATVAVTVPAVDERTRLLAIVALAATGAWTLATHLLPARLRPVAITPAAAGAVLLAGFAVTTIADAVARWATLNQPYSQDFAVRLGTADAWGEPLVAAPAVGVIVALLAVSLSRFARPITWLTYGGTATAVAALATIATYDVPLVVLSTGGWLLTAAVLALALTSTGVHRVGHGAVSWLLASASAMLALPTPWLATVAAVLAVAVAVTLLVGRADPLPRLGGLLLAPAAALIVTAVEAGLSVEVAWAGTPVMLAVGVLAIALPRLEVEIPAALIAVIALAVATPAAGDTGGSLALHLTVLAALVSATALINPERRVVAPAGGVLFLLATWVRLADLGVTAPEPYTLPLALVLCGLGLWHLHRNPDARTSTALLPGLSLATIPSLLWVLDDPVTLRALLLGAACLALAVAGAWLRWSAPLVVGAVVGAVVVLRELGPYAATWPQWLWIGLAGTVLTVVGVTWERRLNELRTAVGYVARLR